MPDILILPASNADDDLTDAIVLNDVTLPATNLDAVALGLSTGVAYVARIIGERETFTVSVTVSATGGVSIPAASVSGAGVREITSSGAIASPAVTADGTGAATSIPETAYSREYTTDTGNETIDLSTIGPAEVGSATYALTAYTGASLAGSTLTIDTTTASDGTVTVRRTDDNGDRDLVLTLTLIASSLTVTGGTADLSYGADTRSDATLSFTITGGDYDTESFNVTPAQMDALANGEGRNVIAPTIGLTTDTDTDGQLDSGDVVEVTRAGLWVYPTGNTAPTITRDWRDQAGSLADTDTSYTGDGTETTSVFNRETDGTTTADSATITVDAVAPGAWAFSGPSITASPTITPPTVSGSSITG